METAISHSEQEEKRQTLAKSHEKMDINIEMLRKSVDLNHLVSSLDILHVFI